jgi:hypothetical protein
MLFASSNPALEELLGAISTECVNKKTPSRAAEHYHRVCVRLSCKILTTWTDLR